MHLGRFTKINDVCQKIAKLAIYYCLKFAQLCTRILTNATTISILFLNILPLIDLQTRFEYLTTILLYQNKIRVTICKPPIAEKTKIPKLIVSVFLC